jgi:NifB/MoaA-like Fe-S oxidoreductase
MEDLDRLRRSNIDFHAQLVLNPGVNDGDELDRSVRDLAALDNCLSIAAVPVGLTRYGLERQSKQVRLSRTCMRTLPGKQIAVRRYEPEEARVVIRQAEQWQRQFRKERGETFLHLGDEFYLMCDEEVPPADLYDGYPQIEDGIGITRHFLENLDGYISRARAGNLAGARAVVACGTLIGPTMAQAVDRLNRHSGSQIDVRVIENSFFGSEINISGLLNGGDLIQSMAQDTSSSPVFISSRMISDRTATLLDDLTIDEVQLQMGRQVIPALTLSDVGRSLRHRIQAGAAAA